MQMQTRDVVNYMQIQGQNKQILQKSHLDKSSKWPIFLINYNLTKIFLKKGFSEVDENFDKYLIKCYYYY